MASPFSPAEEQEHSVSKTLFHARLQTLYKRRLRLARAALRAQLEALQDDLRVLYDRNGTHGVQESTPPSIATSLACPTRNVTKCEFISSNVTIQHTTERSEQIVHYTNANLMHIVAFRKILSHDSKTIDAPECLDVNMFLHDTESSTDIRDRICNIDTPSIFTTSTHESVNVDAMTLASWTEGREKFCKVASSSSSSIPVSTDQVVTIDVTSKNDQFVKRAPYLSRNDVNRVNVSNDLPSIYYTREFDSLQFSDSQSVVRFNVSEKQQMKLTYEYLRKIDTYSPRVSLPSSLKEAEKLTPSSLTSRVVMYPQVEGGSGNRCSVFERDRIFVLANTIGNVETGVGFVPTFRQQTDSIIPISTLRTDKPYFMNFGRVDVVVSFFDKRQGHVAYAPSIRIPKTEYQMTNSNPVSLTNRSRNDIDVKHSDRSLEIDRPDTMNFKPDVIVSHLFTDPDSSSPLPPSRQYRRRRRRLPPLPPLPPPPPTTTSFHSMLPPFSANAYFKTQTTSPVSFVVPRTFNEEDDEPVLEIDEEGQAILDS